jgi:hypothetical protein
MVGITINFAGSRNSPGLRTFVTPDGSTINGSKENGRAIIDGKA